jgi:hypothetical protein
VSFSDITERETIRNITRNTAPSAPPATIYVALYLVAPGDDGSGGTEVSTGGGTNYARQGVTTGTSGTGVGSGWTDPTSSGGQSANVADIAFPAAGASYGGAIVAVGLWRVSSGGTAADFIATGPSTDPTVTIASTQQYVIPAGTLTVTAT